VLVYPKSMNWDCDPNWDYEKALKTDEDEDEDEGRMVEDREGNREEMMSLLGGDTNNAEEAEIEDELEGNSEEEEEEEEEEETEEEAELRLKRARRRRRRRNGGKRRRGGRKRSKSLPTDEESDDDTVQDPVEVQKTRTQKIPRSDSATARTVDKVRTGGREDKKAIEKRLEDRVSLLMKRYGDPFVRDTSKNGKKGEGQGRGVNPYLEALRGKGLPASSVAMAVYSITSRWEHGSVSSNVDYLMGLGHIFVHYQEMSIGASIFKDVLDIYRAEGLLLPCHDRECGNEHPWSLDRVPQEGYLAPLGRCFIGMIDKTFIENLFFYFVIFVDFFSCV
jgi:hypothetical protein